MSPRWLQLLSIVLWRCFSRSRSAHKYLGKRSLAVRRFLSLRPLQYISGHLGYPTCQYFPWVRVSIILFPDNLHKYRKSTFLFVTKCEWFHVLVFLNILFDPHSFVLQYQMSSDAMQRYRPCVSLNHGGNLF